MRLSRNLLISPLESIVRSDKFLARVTHRRRSQCLREVEVLECSTTRQRAINPADILLNGIPHVSPAHLTLSRVVVIRPILAEKISENPCCSGNREGLGVFAPIRMIVGIRKKQRYPHE
jgi:hypothetical protein